MIYKIRKMIHKHIVKIKINQCARHKQTHKGEFIEIEAPHKFDTAKDIEINHKGSQIIYN